MTLQPIEAYYDKADRLIEESVPSGPVWRGENFLNLLKALSRAYARAERESDRQVLFEIHPESTYDLLPEWERALGLPLPGGDFENQSLQQRRRELSYWVKPGKTYTKDEIKEAFRQYRYDVSAVERVEPFSVNSTIDTSLYDERWDYVIELLLESVPGHIVRGEDIDYTELQAIAGRILPIPFIPFVRRSESVLPPGPPINVAASPKGESVLLEWTKSSSEHSHVLIEVEHPINTHQTISYRTPESAVRYLVKDLMAGLETRFNLWSVRSDGARSAPVVVSAAPLDTEPPLQVDRSSIRSVSSSTSIALNWDLLNHSDVVKTIVSAEREDSTDENIENVEITSRLEQETIFRGLSFSNDTPTGYVFSFVTVDADGNESEPTTYTAWTVDELLPPLQNVEAFMRPDEIEFRWSYPLQAGNTGFIATVAGDLVSGNVVKTSSSGATSLILPISDLLGSAEDQNVTYTLIWSNGSNLASAPVSVTASMHDSNGPPNPVISAVAESPAGILALTVTAPDDDAVDRLETRYYIIDSVTTGSWSDEIDATPEASAGARGTYDNSTYGNSTYA